MIADTIPHAVIQVHKGEILHPQQSCRHGENQGSQWHCQLICSQAICKATRTISLPLETIPVGWSSFVKGIGIDLSWDQISGDTGSLFRVSQRQVPNN